jgi:hypothetical protein
MPASPRQQIITIDKQINATIRVLLLRIRVKPTDAAAWQAAWDRHPDLHSQYRGLYAMRGRAQQERDAQDHIAFMRAKPRSSRRKKCPTCGANAAVAT